MSFHPTPSITCCRIAFAKLFKTSYVSRQVHKHSFETTVVRKYPILRITWYQLYTNPINNDIFSSFMKIILYEWCPQFELVRCFFQCNPLELIIKLTWLDCIITETFTNLVYLMLICFWNHELFFCGCVRYKKGSLWFWTLLR